MSETNVEIYYSCVSSDIPEDMEFDLVVYDEGHHESCLTMQYHLEQLGEFPIIFLSATPDRADGVMVKYNKLINPISRSQAVEEGYLTRSHINTILLVPSEHNEHLIHELIEQYIDEMSRMIMFFRTKKEVNTVTQLLKKHNKKAVAMVDQTPAQVDDELNKFSTGETDILVSCMKLGEGVDVKNCHSVFIGRTLGSYPLLNQIIGRASRPDHEVCTIWEMVNPLSKKNLESVKVVGEADQHRLFYRKKGQWLEASMEW